MSFDVILSKSLLLVRSLYSSSCSCHVYFHPFTNAKVCAVKGQGGRTPSPSSFASYDDIPVVVGSASRSGVARVKVYSFDDVLTFLKCLERAYYRCPVTGMVDKLSPQTDIPYTLEAAHILPFSMNDLSASDPALVSILQIIKLTMLEREASQSVECTRKLLRGVLPSAPLRKPNQQVGQHGCSRSTNPQNVWLFRCLVYAINGNLSILSADLKGPARPEGYVLNGAGRYRRIPVGT